METKKSFNEKLLAVQSELNAVTKDKENPFFKSSYADINSYIEAIKPVLTKHRLILTQGLSNVYGRPAITTRIADADGADSYETTVTIPDAPDPQKMGSAITYFRRYALQSLFVMTAEDDDANNASGKSPF